jgi:hypothetical protein
MRTLAMSVFILTLLALFISHASFAVVDVRTPVPPPPNVSFPNYRQKDAAPTTLKTDPVKPATKRDYFATLFDEVEVAKQMPPPLSKMNLYDKLSKESVAHSVLHEQPNLLVGPLNFRPLARNAPHAWEVKKGQELLLQAFGGKPYHYRGMADSIDHQINDPGSPYSDTDWVLMANAFRTLQAPGTSNKAHMLGGFLAEYVLLAQIKKQENKVPLTAEDRAFLSSLHYDLAQLYKAMYRNDEELFENRNHGHLSLPIDPIYRDIGYDHSYPDVFDIPYDTLFGMRLNFLENALLFDPYDDYSWAQLIDFAAFDLIDPWYYNQFSPIFWTGYFPYGLSHVNVIQLQNRWKMIHTNIHVMQNIHLRVTALGGERALKRLATVHSRPLSKINKIIVQSSHLSTTKHSKDVLKSQKMSKAKGSKSFGSPRMERKEKMHHSSHKKAHNMNRAKRHHKDSARIHHRDRAKQHHQAWERPFKTNAPRKSIAQGNPSPKGWHQKTPYNSPAFGGKSFNKPPHSPSKAATPAIRAIPAKPAIRATPEVRAKPAVRAERSIRAVPAHKATVHEHKKKH